MNEKRRFGFALTTKELKDRKREEKTRRWSEKLERADIDKLRAELVSLKRAKFLSPQQCERKRLVERMIAGMEKKKTVSCEEMSKEVATSECSSSESSDDKYMNLFVADPVDTLAACNQAIKVAELVPRQLRKKTSNRDDDFSEKKRAKIEEGILLSKDTVGDNINDFFESLDS